MTDTMAAITGTDNSQLAMIFRAMLRDGVVRTPDSAVDLNRMAVTAGSGMQSSVASGRAIGAGYLATSDAASAVTHTSAHATLGRIDLVVVRFNLTDKVVSREILAGTPAADPTTGIPALTQTAALYEIPLAQVLVPAAAVSAASFTYTDRRNWARGTESPGAYVNTVSGQSITGTTTSNTLLTSMTATLNTDGGDLDVDFSGEFSVANPAALLKVAFQLDGNTAIDVATVNPSQSTVTAFYRYEGVAAGLRTVKVYARTAGGGDITVSTRRLKVGVV